MPLQCRDSAGSSRSCMGRILVLGSLASLTLIGFLTSTFYNSPLDITMEFEGESPILWPYWGLRSLVRSARSNWLLLSWSRLAIQLWRLAFHAFPPCVVV